MVSKILSKVFGSRNQRVLKLLKKVVAQINRLEESTKALSDEQLQARTDEFRQRYADGEVLEKLLPEAFATVREASRRTLGMRHFDVQLIGGMVLHDGRIAEMRTGEGKTLVAPLAAYLNAIGGKGVHVVTVNDYLARRDAEWMGRVYHFLGLSVGVINSSGGMGPDSSSYHFDPEYLKPEQGFPRLRPVERREAYGADILYGTNNEFGFDYLRDNMAFTAAEKSQRELNFAIVDEVDSILIDEARTPLIISGPTDDTSELYTRINKLIPRLTKQEVEDGPGDYSVDEKARQVFLTDDGHIRAEELLEEEGMLGEGESLYDASNIILMHHLNSALRAYVLFQKDVDYIVKDGREIVIVDEFTGRTMPGRRWSEGLHQAVEAKEGVPIQNENQTLASITFQNYFRLYTKLAGMTGTADTEAFEFQQIYGLEVIVIPTHKPMIREDNGDQVYLTAKEKFNAIIEDIKYRRGKKQPVLVGTASIETSEYLSGLLNKERFDHQVLNAKHHEHEAQIVAQAGRAGTVTIATNMAGRGTDIVLGGNLQAELNALEATDEAATEKLEEDWRKRHQAVIAAGGLHIIGTERHESRRIDNQLRGRSGRQGDAGSSRFYLSMEDNLMRIFASDRVAGFMQKLGMEEGEAIEHRWVTNAIEKAQRKVEGRNFDIRKQLLEFDDVANDQRKVIYEWRNDLMSAEEVSATIEAYRRDIVTGVIDGFISPKSMEEQWDIPGLEQALEKEFALRLEISRWLEADDELHEETLRKKILDEISFAYEEKEAAVGTEVLRHFEKAIILQILDGMWKEHLAAMDYLRQGIHLRGYAQKNPKQEYKREAFEMFTDLLERIKREVVGIVSRVQVRAEEDVETIEEQRRRQAPVDYSHPRASGPYPVATGAMGEGEPQGEGPPGAGTEAPPDVRHTPFVRDGRKVGRNEPCPCGSGKKYKQCHGKLA